MFRLSELRTYAIPLHNPYFFRCRAEILSTIGNAQCQASHLPKLPYIQAMITEVQRVSRVAPMSLLHITREKTVVDGFKIPVGSAVVANLSFITNNPSTFVRPEEFNPDRWIGQDGK